MQKIQATDSFQQTKTVHGVIWAPWVDAASTFDNFQVSGTPPAPPVATTVTVTPATASVGVAATRTLTAVVRDQFNQPMANQAVTWTATANGVVTLAPTGLTVTVTGASVGSATVTATSGALTGTATVTVTAAPPPNANQVFDSFTAADGSVAGRTPETNAANSTWQVFGPAGVAIQNNALHVVGTPTGYSGVVVDAGIADATIEIEGLDHWRLRGVGRAGGALSGCGEFRFCGPSTAISGCSDWSAAGSRDWGAQRSAAAWEDAPCGGDDARRDDHGRVGRRGGDRDDGQLRANQDGSRGDSGRRGWMRRARSTISRSSSRREGAPARRLLPGSQQRRARRRSTF